MFTGIVSEIGKVKKLKRKNDITYIEIECRIVLEGINTGDSIAVNGVCLSVVKSAAGVAGFDVVANTLNKTNLKRLKINSKVNLENALKMGDDISGHMVSGHIDQERVIKTNRKTKDGWVLEINVTEEDKNYLIPKGSISIDGASLTIGAIDRNSIKIFLIPHTIENTVLISKKPGDYVNVEFDLLGKYSKSKKETSIITKNMLYEKGFM